MIHYVFYPISAYCSTMLNDDRLGRDGITACCMMIERVVCSMIDEEDVLIILSKDSTDLMKLCGDLFGVILLNFGI